MNAHSISLELDTEKVLTFWMPIRRSHAQKVPTLSLPIIEFDFPTPVVLIMAIVSTLSNTCSPHICGTQKVPAFQSFGCTRVPSLVRIYLTDQSFQFRFVIRTNELHVDNNFDDRAAKFIPATPLLLTLSMLRNKCSLNIFGNWVLKRHPLFECPWVVWNNDYTNFLTHPWFGLTTISTYVQFRLGVRANEFHIDNEFRRPFCQVHIFHPLAFDSSYID